jgi:high affinity Mn2+ porin
MLASAYQLPRRFFRSGLVTALAAAIILAHPYSLSAQRADTARGSETSSTLWAVALLGAQIDLIGQRLGSFHSSYQGANSLISTGDAQISQAYGVYAGGRIGARLSGYLDVEMVRGAGVGHVIGLGGPTNGDVIRQGSADLGNGPYVARAFLRYAIPLGGTAVDTLERAPDQMPGVMPTRRVEFVAGKFAASDIFDVNRYANSTRTQFMDWGLFQNTAWDFAADTRGYTNGVAVAWVATRWAIRIGSFQMPTKANGNKFDPDIGRARGDNFEATLTPRGGGPTIRILGFVNHARMGSYSEALAVAQENNVSPDIAADDRPGRIKYGFGLNLEQPLADSGETGAFVRAGWSDGATESFAFAEVDHHLSGGVQVSGVHWSRKADRFAVALLLSGLSAVHREYLEAGGSGFLLGDGRLDYGVEEILESFYRAQLGPYVQVSPDVQLIRHPGYNRARGPASVISLRINLRY